MSEQTAENIFSSTGEVGTSVRQDGRLYHNAEMFYDDAAVLEATFDGLMADAGRRPDDISRVVFRGIVSDEAMEAIRADGLADKLEVALPLREFNQPGWLIYLAENDASRQPLEPIESMISATSEYRNDGNGGNNGLAEEAHIKDSLGEEDLEELFDLWGHTFGWERDEVVALARRLQEQKRMDPAERSVWFSAVALGPHLVSLAMAERLSLPGKDHPLDLVESTEWQTHTDHKRMGYMVHALKALNSQVIADLHPRRSAPPLIYAECNFTNRADKAGYRAGFRIPPRQYAAQLAIQNVTVDDNIRPAGLRDFSFMYLPPSSFAV